MTAEIAILNKSAVALASDSAVTISAGDKEEKIFDSAEKLFELSYCNPIGIMIFNGMHFAEIPIASLIKQFRDQHVEYEKVAAAAQSFLLFLAKEGREAPQSVKDDMITSAIAPLFSQINERYMSDFQKLVVSQSTKTGFSIASMRTAATEVLDKIIAAYNRAFKNLDDAEFVGGAPPRMTNNVNNLLKRLAKKHIITASDTQIAAAVEVASVYLRKKITSSGFTGIVIAGFGTRERFPTLVSLEIDGMVSNRLKVIRKDVVDIDRKGPKARVVPFAQKEMVERFLYGLDSAIQNRIATFCLKTVPAIGKQIIENFDFDTDDTKKEMAKHLSAAESAFLDGLRNRAFRDIESQSKSDIEEMVEFMPKPELARMAEALVDLTSIKRRVSRGMETVGGPIDVAVISQTEGFIWVKRKHYFEKDLNPRYLTRVKAQMPLRRNGNAKA
jgi:hypothetical protein